MKWVIAGALLCAPVVAVQLVPRAALVPPTATRPTALGAAPAEKSIFAAAGVRAQKQWRALSEALPRGDRDQWLVVLDPGHGGSNTGARGPGEGRYEKHFTLSLARRMRRHLEGRGIWVVLTRERDEYRTLRDRAQLANQYGADLFVSLHANATRLHSQRGYETFIIAPGALDLEAQALHAGEDVFRLGATGATALVLDDYERGASLEEAADLAARIQRALGRVWGPQGDRGVRQGPMGVLLGPTMPAVLVEVGFIDHPSQGPQLFDPAMLDRVSRALATAVATHLEASR